MSHDHQMHGGCEGHDNEGQSNHHQHDDERYAEEPDHTGNFEYSPRKHRLLGRV